MKSFIRSFVLIMLMPALASAQVKKPATFKIVPLGVLGGIDESNLSAYMVAPAGSGNYVCLDAGTLHAGIQKAVAAKIFPAPAEQVLKRNIKGYFISHAHLDHVSGLIINSPDDSTKSIFGLKSTLETIRTHYFTWDSWANFADDGSKPQLKKYHYSVMQPGEEANIAGTEMQVTAYPLAHSNLTSTAFLVKSANGYLLYLGDTGADTVEHCQNMSDLWKAVAPLVKSGALKGIMIEVSFPNEQPEKSLFGHLTPRLLMLELDNLAKASGASLKNFNIVVTHLKPPYKSIVAIEQQLKAANKRGLNLIYPQQGKEIKL